MEREYKDWRVESKCQKLTPDEYDRMFFPEAGRTINEAKAFCSDCPVKTACLQSALQNNDDGIWAGTCKRDRDRMVKLFNMPQARGGYINVRKGKPKVKRRAFTYN